MATPVLISACLLGLPTRYDGQGKETPAVDAYLEQQDLLPIPICPEQLGGLPTPRPKAQIVDGQGLDVLDGTAKVLDEEDNDVSAPFKHGAKIALEIGRACGCRVAILKEKSPSCGRHRIYQAAELVSGHGVTAALLLQEGFEVLSDEGLS